MRPPAQEVAAGAVFGADTEHLTSASAPTVTGAPHAVEAELDALPLNRRHGLVFALCAAGLFFESLNLQVMSYVAPRVAAEWRLGPTLLGVLISAAIVGMLVGTYVFGALADRHGRRLAFQVTVGIFSVLTALSGLAGQFWQLALARFGAGVGIGGSIPVETAVLAEFMPARLRGRAMALWAVALPVGGLVAPICVAAMPDSLGWRGLLFIGGIPALLVLLVRRAIPETPLYLAAKGLAAQAELSLAWIARRAVHAVVVDAGTNSRFVRSASPEFLLFAPTYRAATVTAWLINFGSFFAYYGFVLWMPAFLGGYRGVLQGDVLRFMLTLASAGLCGRLAVMAVSDRIGRPAIVIICSLLAATGLTLFAAQRGFGEMLACACSAAFFLEGSFSAIIPFVAELYPSQARATGVGWAGGMGRLGTALAPMCIGVLVQVAPAYAVLLLAGGALLAASAAAAYLVRLRPAAPV